MLACELKPRPESSSEHSFSRANAPSAFLMPRTVNPNRRSAPANTAWSNPLERPQKCPTLGPTQAQEVALRSDEELMQLFWQPGMEKRMKPSMADFLGQDDMARFAFLKAVNQYKMVPVPERRNQALLIFRLYLEAEATAPINCNDAAEMISQLERSLTESFERMLVVMNMEALLGNAEIGVMVG